MFQKTQKRERLDRNKERKKYFNLTTSKEVLHLHQKQNVLSFIENKFEREREKVIATAYIMTKARQLE